MVFPLKFEQFIQIGNDKLPLIQLADRRHFLRYSFFLLFVINVDGTNFYQSCSGLCLAAVTSKVRRINELC